MMKFRTSRSEPMLQPFHFQKDSMVQEQFAFDCDINNIVAGMTSPLPMRQPVSDEVKKFSPDMYEQALLTKAKAENAFMELPSEVRTFFKNNPKNMLEFISKPENEAKCIELGLMEVNERKALFHSIDEGYKEFRKTMDSINSAEKTDKTAPAVIPKESQGG